MLSKASQRIQFAYAVATTRAYENFGLKIEQVYEDHLDDFYDRYPVNHDPAHRDSLRSNVMRQLRHVLYKTKDMNHLAFLEMEKNSIDWLAQPYFRGQQGVRLSSIIKEYEYHYANPTYTPSRACQDMFRISVQPVQPVQPVHEAEASSSISPPSDWDAEQDSQPSKRSRE